MIFASFVISSVLIVACWLFVLRCRVANIFEETVNMNSTSGYFDDAEKQRLMDEWRRLWTTWEGLAVVMSLAGWISFTRSLFLSIPLSALTVGFCYLVKWLIV